MDFRTRLLGISLAGGLAAAAACAPDGDSVVFNYAPDAADESDAADSGSDPDGFSCNANPDPCCNDPDGAACLAKDAASDAPADGGDAASDGDAGGDALSD